MRSDQGGVRGGDEKCYLFVKIPAPILIVILVLLELSHFPVRLQTINMINRTA